MISKEQHESFASFFAEPTRERLRDLLKLGVGETDYLEFKSHWPDISKLAKLVLAMANGGGGVVVVGVEQAASGVLHPAGLGSLLDKADLIPKLNSFVPKELEFQILDFSYSASEYGLLVGKSFQVLLVEDHPSQIPFLALRDGEGIRANSVYVRSGTRTAEATQVGLQEIVNRRIKTGRSSQPSIDVEKHLHQLRVIDEMRPHNDSWFNQFSYDEDARFTNRESSDFAEFLEEAYEAKKNQIWRLLGLG